MSGNPVRKHIVSRVSSYFPIGGPGIPKLTNKMVSFGIQVGVWVFIRVWVFKRTYYILQGNIRVFCRVRPLVGDELYGSDGEIHHMNFPDEDQKILELEKMGDISLSEVSAA